MFDKLIDKLSLDRGKDVKKKAVIATKKQYFAPNTKIAYQESLVPTLRGENREIMSTYWKVMTAAQNRKRDLTLKYLGEFKVLLVDHTLKQNTSLYLYLRHTAKKPSSQKAVKSIKAEMDQMSRGVMRFLDLATQEDYEFDADFIEQLKKVGDALNQRIEKEEAFVYPNYRPR